MTEFLRNHPIALHHCLLYQFLRGESFEDFCTAVGKDVINKEEFQFWFDRFEQGKFDDKEQPVADMRKVLRNDKQALRACVMYEWLTTKNMKLVNVALSPFTKYINFCKVIGDDVMGYREFDMWFYRFENGMFDLKFERDKDEKFLELSDMPIDIMKNVVKYVGIFDRVSLAKTSRSIKTFVEDQKSFSKKLVFRLDCKTAKLNSEDRRITIRKYGDDCYRSYGKQFLQNKRLIKGVSHWKQGIQELVSILKYPKLHLEEFSSYIPHNFNGPMEGELEVLDNATQVLGAAFKSLQHLRVKKLKLITYKMNLLLNVLPSLEPGYLTRIELYIPADSCLFEELEKLEQWKQAKSFKMIHTLYFAPLFHLYHFEEFHVRLLELPVKDIREMKEILFDSPDFEKCTIELPKTFDMDTIRHEFGDLIQGNTYHHPIPNSEDYFEIKIRYYNRSCVISITRKQK